MALFKAKRAVMVTRNIAVTVVAITTHMAIRQIGKL